MLDNLMEVMKKKVFHALKLEEYFVYDEVKILEKFQDTLKENCIKIVEKEEEADEDENIFSRSVFDILSDYIRKRTHRKGAKRFGLIINMKSLVNDHVAKKPKLYSI
jgi:hypothetical protein